MVKKAKKKFKGGAQRNAVRQTRKAKYGHMSLPKGVSVYKAEPGSRVSLDIMPYMVTDANHPDRDDEYGVAVPGELWYKRPYYLHRSIGTNNESVVCPTSNGQKCPICEYRAQMLKEGADWNDDSVKALKPSMRNLYAVIPKGSKAHEEAPHIWDMSQFLFQSKLNEEISEDEDYDTFPDLEDGYTLRVRFSEESFGQNKFADTSRIDFVERDEAYPESIMDDIPNLDEVLEIPSYKTVEAIFFGGASEEEAEDEDEDDDVMKGRGAPRARTLQDEDEEADEDEEVDDDEDEEDDKDSKGHPIDEDDEDEPTPEPSPAKRTKKVKPKAKDKGNRCPHGHIFGKDCDEHDECDECTEWEACMDASEGIDE